MRMRYVFVWFVVLLAMFAGSLSGCATKAEPSPSEQQEPVLELRTLSFTIDCENYNKAVAEAVAQQLRELGVDVQVRVWGDWAVLKEALLNKEREMLMNDWGNSTLDPYDLLNPKFETGGRGNYAHYSNPRVDDLLKKGATGTDAAEREKIYREVQEILYDDAPWVFGYAMQEIEASRKTVQNWVPATDSRINLHRVSLTEGDTLVVGIRATIESLDPANHRNRIAETVIRNMFDGLVTRTPDGRVVPEIAESWEAISPTLWEFKIRKGITFHNGEPLTADDVKFTFDRIITEGGLGNGKSSPRKAGLLDPVTKVEKVDDYTVRFHLSAPWPIILQMLVHQQIVPKDYVERVGSEEFARKPIGAGPFKFVEGKLDERVVMERYDGYYGGSPDIPVAGPAKIKRAIFEVIPETSTRVAALQSGQAHIIQSVPPELVPELDKDPNCEVKTVEGTRVYFLEMNVTRPPFDDVRVRQAMNYAIDWDLIIEKVLGGYATRLNGPLLPHGFARHTGLSPYPFDPDRARQLLRDAGYRTE